MGFTVIVTVLVWVTLFSDAVTLYVNESSPLKFESGVYVTEPDDDEILIWPFEVPEVSEYASVTGSFALAAKEPLNILSSSTEIEFGASVIANGTLASPPPPPPPQEETRTSNAINFKDFI